LAKRVTKHPNGRRFLLPVVIERDRDGYYAECPVLQGCYTQGDTYDEVVANLKDAIKLHIQDRLESGEPIIEPEMVTLATLEVTV
jgi:predicted RNase H-like HicB family nuclease